MLEADNAHMIKWWVAASVTIHRDMHSHAGGMLLLGKGSVYSVSMSENLYQELHRGQTGWS